MSVCQKYRHSSWRFWQPPRTCQYPSGRRSPQSVWTQLSDHVSTNFRIENKYELEISPSRIKVIQTILDHSVISLTLFITWNQFRRFLRFWIQFHAYVTIPTIS